MKELTPYLPKSIMLFSVVPATLEAENEINIVPLTISQTPETIEAEALTERLYEFKSMALKKLYSVDRKLLRTEIDTIKSKIRVPARGIYLSAAAIVIILLLLFLL
jgi:hypothetical protein